ARARRITACDSRESSKSICKEIALQRPKTGKFDYLSELNHPAHSMAFKFFTDDYKTSVFRIRTRRRWGIRTGMRTRARLLKQNENRRDGAATGPWSYLVVRSCGSGRASPPRSR